MIRPIRTSASLLAALLVTGGASAARAQVEVTTLAAPDAFTTAGRETGLPPGLWRGASVETARSVLALLATKPLTPAGAQLARRILATGAQGPTGAGSDPALVAARANALSAVGDPKAAAVLLARAPGVDRSPELARAAAENALLAGDDARACAVAEGLSSSRDDIYWLRLRAYCQAIGGKTAQAQLTFELAQTQARDAVFGRLMAAKLAGGGNPGAASLRNGLDFALSRSLGLDLAAAKPAPAVAAALAGGEPRPPLSFDPAAAPADLAPLAEGIAKGEPVRYGTFMDVMNTTQSGDAKARTRGQAAGMLAIALSGPLSPETRSLLALQGLPEGKAPIGRNLALESAAQQKLIGEAALLALWTCAEAGPNGPAIGDRVRIVSALQAVGLEADARAFALEGLLALK
jgi:hypothetical protein